MRTSTRCIVAGSFAVALTLSACTKTGGNEVRLLGDTMAGQGLTVVEEHGTPTVWVSSEDNSDPRAGGKPDPGACSVSGGGEAKIAAPDEGNAVLGKTNLYALAKVEDLSPPATITCSGANFKQIYVGTLQ